MLKKTKSINTYLVDHELKYGDYKIFCSLLHEMNKIQIKDHNIRNNRINKIFLS